jgi:DNA mismatch endonuclease (patch repair protein)
MMVDQITVTRRSWNMSRIKSKNTKPEVILRRCLRENGYNYSKRDDRLVGKPDILFRKKHVAIFVHGCFWHMHKRCDKKIRIPDTNNDYWTKKLLGNVLRDKKIIKQLRNKKWKVIVVWECEIKADIMKVFRKIQTKLDKPYSVD